MGWEIGAALFLLKRFGGCGIGDRYIIHAVILIDQRKKVLNLDLNSLNVRHQASTGDNRFRRSSMLILEGSTSQ